MEQTEIARFAHGCVEIIVKECFTPAKHRGDGQDLTDYTVFVKDISGGGTVMFTFDTDEEAMSLFKHMLKANIA